jgi:hypothetical protein
MSDSTTASYSMVPDVQVSVMEPLPSNDKRQLLAEFRSLQLVLQFLATKDDDASIMTYDKSETSPEKKAHDSGAHPALQVAIATILVRDIEIVAVATCRTASEALMQFIVTKNPDTREQFFNNTHAQWSCILLPPGISHLPSVLSDPWYGLQL